MPFGVELPENITAASVPNAAPAPETAPVTTAPEIVGDPESQLPVELTKQELIELEKLEKFKLDGQELTLKDLRNQMLMRKDYTKKTQEMSEARKYVDNFDVDLAKIIENPSLMSKFKEVYPTSYVEKAERILKMAWKDNLKATEEQKPETQNQRQDLPPEILAKLDKVERLEKWMMGQEESKQQERTSTVEAQLNDWFTDLSSKYKFADPDAVLTKAQALADAGQAIDKATLDNIFKEKNDFYQKSWATEKQQKQQQQLKAGAQAKEAGPGGDVPSAPPKKYDSLKDVRKSLLAQFE